MRITANVWVFPYKMCDAILSTINLHHVYRMQHTRMTDYHIHYKKKVTDINILNFFV